MFCEKKQLKHELYFQGRPTITIKVKQGINIKEQDFNLDRQDSAGLSPCYSKCY